MRLPGFGMSASSATPHTHSLSLSLSLSLFLAVSLSRNGIRNFEELFVCLVVVVVFSVAAFAYAFNKSIYKLK